ncbi:HAD family hydrolase [Streptomyces sp. NPDC058964]|uniref:HAD family hydrolase n=1 Tax=Streptomyces sp. NPDC058964 TaxID=3346681 RepID=UPI003694F103
MTELGLPDTILACLFDLDGVVTKTAVVHAAAWKEAFDQFLHGYEGERARPFDAVTEYDEYVDGRPRADGVRSFLRSRGIELPEGVPDDPPDVHTVHGLGNRKNELLLEKIRTEGVEAYDGTLRYLEAVRARGLRTAIVSSSANCRDVLRSIGAEHLFDVRIDGVAPRARRGPAPPRPPPWRPAPAPGGGGPGAPAVFEDALAGMDAGRAGRFGYVVGVDRVGQRDALYTHGADVVVKDLAELGGKG